RDFDISSDGVVAYVHYTDGKPELRLFNLESSTETKVFELDNEKMMSDPTFSNNGEKLALIEMNKNLESNLNSTVHQVDMTTLQVNKLFSAPSVVTEIEYSPMDESIFYLKAGVFTNYSPIASKRPHDFDVFEYRFLENEHIQHTNRKEYSMDFLT